MLLIVDINLIIYLHTLVKFNKQNEIILLI